VRILELQPGDEERVAAAHHLFDRSPAEGPTSRFLAEPGSHLLVAYDDAGRPIGFVSGVELTHPDKGTELFLYELAVAEPARGRGVGTALVESLAAVARERGCYGMFVLTDEDNAAAQAAYRRAGAARESRSVMLEWDFR
jgi:ribosomal protein S18 acetylase RimI-like enzyme